MVVGHIIVQRAKLNIWGDVFMFDNQTVIILVLIVILVYILTRFVVIPQDTKAVVERFGAYEKTLESGMHFLLPIADKIRSRVSTKAQPYAVRSHIVELNGVPLFKIGVTMAVKITDPRAYTYELKDGEKHLRKIFEAQCTRIVRHADDHNALDEETFKASLKQALMHEEKLPGLRIDQVDIDALEML